MRTVDAARSAVVVLATLAAGCGGPVAVPVEGVVRVGGEPREGVVVAFLPASGGPGGGLTRTGPDGRFAIGRADEASGLPPGRYKVTFSLTGSKAGEPGEFSGSLPQGLISVWRVARSGRGRGDESGRSWPCRMPARGSTAGRG